MIRKLVIATRPGIDLGGRREQPHDFLGGKNKALAAHPRDRLAQSELEKPKK